MTVEDMTVIGEFTRDIVYSPVMYAFIILIFLFLVLGGIDE